MRIGVMLRSIEEKQGIGIYSRNLMDEMLIQDQSNEYVLFYRNAACLGRYRQHPHVREKAVPAPSKLLWDQALMPMEARRERLDVIFHTKFTVPFLASCKTVMTVHGASWFAHPELYPAWDVSYIRAVMPRYCRKATAILSNSELTTRDYIRYLKVPPRKIHTIPLGTSRGFRRIDDPERLRSVRRKYDLPNRYILSVIKYDPRKNFKNLIAAFRLLRQRIACKLVVVGIGCEKYIAEYGLDRDGTAGDMRFLGWMDHADLPVIYNLAHCLFFPSVYEEFGIPSCEAMACGCPPVVSNTGALPDNVADAGILVNPFDPEEMADALERLYTDEALRESYVEKCLVRARFFTWERCAQQTLRALTDVARSDASPRGDHV